MNTIEINDTNYQSYTRLDIVAFSFARGSAMGEPGGIIIIDAEGQDYHANYLYGRPHPGNILVLKKDICPAFHKAVEEAHFEVLGQLYQRWKRIVRNLLGKGKGI